MALAETLIGPKTFHRRLTRSPHKAVRKRSILSSLMLTPMVDMFSLLVIFLLRVFSTSPEMLINSSGITLPQAATGIEIKEAPVLSLTKTEAFLDKDRLGSLQNVLTQPAALVEKLKKLRTHWISMHPNGVFPGEINVEAHSEIPSTSIANLMKILPSEGFNSILLVTMPVPTSTEGKK